MDLVKHLRFSSGYFDLEMYDDALIEAEQALDLEPENSGALALKSAALFELKRLEEAEPCLARLAALSGNNTSVLINLAYVRRRTQSLDAAVETLQQALQIDPKYALAHFNMACYRALQNRPEEAMLLLRNAISLEPSLREAAWLEQDFEGIKDLPEFKSLIGW